VKIDKKGGIILRCPDNSECPNKIAGIIPKLKKVCSTIYVGSKIWLRKIYEQEKIINQEIIGFLLVGFSSANGKKNI
tara:strand:+ start:196 stop:426 length:231 start_codon:yes stop_codon:yes gene_type:complete